MIATLPISRITHVSRTPNSAVSESRSPFTGTSQTQFWGGEWWEYSIEFATMSRADGKILSAFFASLGGKRTPFLFVDPWIRNPSGLGTPLVNGAGQSGYGLVTDGWSATGLKTGDFFSLGADVNTRLYQVTADVIPVSGGATVQIWPALRSAPADNQPLIVISPPVLLRLTGPVPTDLDITDTYRFSVSAREAI